MPVNTRVRDQAMPGSIWLLVQINGQGKVFEFVPSNDRCVVIGSASGADVRLDGLAPIAVYLQRDGTGIRVIPAHAETGCRVNTQPVFGPCVIQSQGLVELSGYQVALYISGVNPACSANAPAASPAGTSSTERAQNGPRPGEPARGGSARAQAKTFVLGSRPALNPAEAVAPRNADSPYAAAAVQSNSIEPTPILALGSDAGRRPRVLGTQALTPSELAAIRSMAAARQPAPPERIETPMAAKPEPFDQTRHSASSIPVGSLGDGYPAPGSELPKVIPFEPMRVAANQLQGASSSNQVGSHSTVVEVKAVDPAILTGRQRPEAIGTAGRGNHFLAAQRPSGHAAQTPRAIDSLPADAAASYASAASGSGFSPVGQLARRHPAALIGGTIIGGLGLIVLIAGVAQLLKPVAPPRVAQSAVSSPSSAEMVTASTNMPSAVAPNRVAAPQTTGAVPQVLAAANPSPKGSAASPPQDERASIGGQTATAAKLPVVEGAADLSVSNAAGHLFASRLQEAEQAYRELAANNPKDPIYPTVVRLLVKRNSPDCRSQNHNTRKSCPTVKP